MRIKDYLFKTLQFIFLLSIISGNILMYFIPIVGHHNMDLLIPIITSILVIIFFFVNMYQENVVGRGLYLFSQPKLVYTIDGDYYIKLIHTSDYDYKYEVVICRRRFIFWSKLYSKECDILQSGNFSDQFNRSVAETIDKYKNYLESIKRKSYYTDGIFKDLKEWDGLVGNEREKAILQRDKRLKKLLGRKEEEKLDN